MNDSIKWWFWPAGLFRVAADTAHNQTTCGKGEILYIQIDKYSKAIVNFASESLTNQQHAWLTCSRHR